jgi:hypothetical protein
MELRRMRYDLVVKGLRPLAQSLLGRLVGKVYLPNPTY